MSNQVRKLFAQLRKEQKEVEKKIENLVQEAAFNGNRYAVQNLRKEKAIAFGNLMQSVGVQRITPKNYEVVASMPYAPFVEFGTGVNVNVDDEWKDVAILFKGEKAIIGQRPQPFMIPAYNKTIAELTEKLNKYVR